MANQINIVITAEDKATKPIRQTANAIDDASGSTSRFGTALSAIGKTIAISTLALGALGATGFGSVMTYSFNATREVQGYVAGIKSLTSNSEEASSVIKDMVDYVQGKPFDRIDTIKAASQLLGMGRTALQTKEDIELLGKAVIVSGSDWEGLTKIYGQIMASGKLNLDLFDQMSLRLPALTGSMAKELGVNIGDVRNQLMGTSVDADVFRRAMMAALPDVVVAQSANTIDNKLLSLKTSFRNLGFAVLGVDFSKIDGDGQPLVKSGGLLDQMIGGISSLTGLLRSPPVVAAFTGLGQGLTWIGDQVSSLLPMLTAAGSKASDYLTPKFSALGRVVADDLVPVLKKLWQQVIQPLIPTVGSLLVGAFGAAIDVLRIGISVFSSVVSLLIQFKPLVVAVVASFVGYKVAVLAANAVTVAHMAVMQAVGYRYVMLNGQLTAVRAATLAQTVAQGALNVAMSINPIALVVGAVAALAAGLWLLTRSTDEETSAAERLNDAHQKQADAARQAREAEDALRDAQSKVDTSTLSVERAQRSYNEAVAQYGPTSLEAREAANQLKQAQRDLEGSTQALTDKQNEQLVSLSAINGELTKLNGRSINYTVNGKQVAEWEQDGQRFFGGAFASGTNSAPGGWAVVGEHGPERVRLPEGAAVTPAYRARTDDNSSGPSSTISIGTVNITNDTDGRLFFNKLGFVLGARS